MDHHQHKEGEGRNDQHQNRPLDTKSFSGGDGRRKRTGSGTGSGNHEKERSQSPFTTMSEIEFHEQSKIHQVLNAFKDDVVRIKSSEKNKWNKTIESVRSGSALSFGEDFLQQQPHENIPRNEVGCRPSTWKMSFQKKLKNDEKLETKPSSLETIPELNLNSSLKTTQHNIDPAVVKAAPLLKLFIIINIISSYSSGILAGLLIARAWFESFVIYENNSDVGETFSTFLWSTTTILILFTVLGFINRVDTAKEDSNTARNLFLNLIPVLTILVSHYLNQSFQLQRKECMEYLRTKELNPSWTHRIHLCDNYQKLESDIVLIVLRIIPAIAVLGIYTYIYFGKNNSLFKRLEISDFPKRMNSDSI